MNPRLTLGALAGTLLALGIPAHAEFIYIADDDGKVVVYDDQADTISAVGNVSDSFPVSQDIGIAWDANTGRILLLDRGTPMVYAMNPADGTSVELFDPGVQFQGGAVKGTTLYGIDEGLQDVVAYDLNTFNSIPLAGATSLASHTHAMGIDAASGQLYAAGSSMYEIADDGSTTATPFALPDGAPEDIDYYGGDFLAVYYGSEVYSIDGSGNRTVYLDSTRLGPFALSSLSGVALAADGQGQIPTTARFNVTKTFTDDSTDSVDVTLTCNAGLPLVQDFTIEGGDPDGVTFVVNNIPQSGADCTVTESGGPDGYTPVLNGGAGCSWDNVLNGNYSCAIVNEADPAEYSVTLNWVVPDAGLEEETYDVDVNFICDTEILTLNGGTPPGAPTNEFTVTMDDGDTFVITVDTEDGDTECTADQFLTQSGVETSATESCSGANLSAGDSVSCVFTNTVFFEGIPTLSQLGMAIMALLMLSVGLVGFRRFA
jgi:hypothetical protein